MKFAGLDRDFGTSIQPPHVTPASIAMLQGLNPILWLEEVDKFKPTTTRLNDLLQLVDAVYEQNGTIIASANMTPAQLREDLGDSIYRRLFGENDDDSVSRIWDSHAVVRSGLKGK